MDTCPWSQNQLKRLGKHIRDGTEVPIGTPSYNEVMLWYNEVAARVQKRVASVDWTPLLQDRKPEVTSRPKTIDTLRQKLQRERTTPLPNIQDIAGVRFEAEMSLDEQDAVVVAIRGLFDLGEESVKDLRAQPHSGYRAMHIWLRAEARVEIQVRTHLQGAWANMYEAAGDFFGREIRYGSLPTGERERKIVLELQRRSIEDTAEHEAQWNMMAQTQLQFSEIPDVDDPEMKRQRADAEARLTEYTAAVKEYERSYRHQLDELRQILLSKR